MAKKTFNYEVVFTSNVNDKRITLPVKNKAEANAKVRKLKKENQISRNNSKIISGESFILYKDIKIRKR